MIRLIISDPSLLFKAKLNEYINEVIDERNDFNYCSFDFENNSFEEIIDACQTPAFGSDKKVVIVKNPYFFKDSKIKLPFTNKIEDLEKYLYHPNEDCELIITCSKAYLNTKSKTYTIISKVAKIDNLLIENENDLKKYAKNLIKRLNIDIDANAIDELVLRCENDICKLERELAKLSMYQDHIDKKIIEEMVARPLNDDVRLLSNALLKKDRKNIMKIYNDLKLLKVEPINLIALLANQFRLILQVVILKKKNKLDADIAKILNVHPYRVQLANEYANKYPLSQVKDILCELATLDADIKSGKKDRYIDFEIFLATK